MYLVTEWDVEPIGPPCQNGRVVKSARLKNNQLCNSFWCLLVYAVDGVGSNPTSDRVFFFNGKVLHNVFGRNMLMIGTMSRMAEWSKTPDSRTIVLHCMCTNYIRESWTSGLQWRRGSFEGRVSRTSDSVSILDVDWNSFRQVYLGTEYVDDRYHVRMAEMVYRRQTPITIPSALIHVITLVGIA